MHKYLRAVGFSNIKTKKELQALIREIIKTANERVYTSNGPESIYAEYNKEFTKNIGICVRGDFEEDNVFIYSHYFPYLKGQYISSYENITVERHADKESYAGVCDELKVGVSLIFYLQNVVSYLKLKNKSNKPIKGTTLTLTGLSIQGTIMMPIRKDEFDLKKEKKMSQNRNHLIEAARKGDEEAIESLTLEDMDTYSIISKKIQKEDIFTLVDTYFMPYGVECDHYSVLGEILECEKIINDHTKEELYILVLNCNELVISVVINKLDLFGEPEIGRRFKGSIWLQGHINFPNSNE